MIRNVNFKFQTNWIKGWLPQDATRTPTSYGISEALGTSLLLFGIQLLLLIKGALPGLNRFFDLQVGLKNEELFRAIIEPVIPAFTALCCATFLFHFILLTIFKPNRLFYGAIFFAYALSYVFVYYPQGLEPILAPLSLTDPFGFKVIDRLRTPVLVSFIGLNFLAILAFGNGVSGERRILPRALRFFLIGVIGFYLFHVNDPYASDLAADRSPIHKSSEPNILVIGIDGLRPDFFDEALRQGDYPETKRFRSESVEFHRAWTEISRTHAAYHSILHGRSIQELDIRTTDHPLSMDSNKSLSGSWLDRLRQKGFETHFTLSDSTFSFYTPNSHLSSTRSLSPGSDQNLFPHIFFDPITWGWLNNSLGNWLAPRIIGNGAYHVFYWPQTFTKLVLDEVLNWDNANPRIAFFHLTKLHWPGANQYPYVQLRSRSSHKGQKTTSSQFGYDHSFQLNQRGQPLEIERIRSQEIYRDGIRQVLDQFIEPLLSSLRASQRLEDTHVILMSDHGEAFYDASLIPYHKMPGHGSLVGWTEDSNHALLWIRHLHRAPKRIEQNFALHDLIKFVLADSTETSKLEVGKRIELESDRWFARLYPGQQLIRASRLSVDEIQVLGRQVTLSSESLPRHVFEKKRARVIDDWIEYIWPSVYGYYSQAKRGREIRESDWPESAEISDRSRGLFPTFDEFEVSGTWRIYHSKDPVESHRGDPPSRYSPWIQYQIATEELMRDWRPQQAVKRLRELLKQSAEAELRSKLSLGFDSDLSRAGPVLRHGIRMRIFEACRLFPSAFLPNDFEFLNPVEDATERLAQLWCDLRLDRFHQFLSKGRINLSAHLERRSLSNSLVDLSRANLRDAQATEFMRLITPGNQRNNIIGFAELAMTMIPDDLGLSAYSPQEFIELYEPDLQSKRPQKPNLEGPSDFAKVSQLFTTQLLNLGNRESPKVFSAPFDQGIHNPDSLLALDQLVATAQKSPAFGLIGLLDPWYARFARSFRSREYGLKELVFRRILQLDPTISTPTLLIIPELIWEPEQAKVFIQSFHRQSIRSTGLGETQTQATIANSPNLRALWRREILQTSRATK